MKTVEDPRLKDHWYLQPWMTEFRPGEGADPASPAPHISRAVRSRSRRRTVQPEPFEPLRRRLLPAYPWFDPLGIRPLPAVDHRLQSRERRLAAGLLLAALLVYLAINAGFPENLLESLGIDPGHPTWWQLAQAGYWSSLALAALAVWRSGLVPTPRPTAALVGVAGVAALFQIALLVLAGLLLGFGHSPYAHALPNVLANLTYVASVIGAVELTRACVIIVLARSNPTAAVAIGTLVFALVRIPLSRVVAISGEEATFSFLGGDLLPALAVGLVASVLALGGGPLPAIVYAGLLQAFEWLSPILPDLDWAATAFVGTIGPVMVLGVLQPPERDRAAAEQPQQRSGLAIAVTAVVVIWFVGGLFGIRPMAISGPSMNPTLHVGDLVIVQEVDATTIVVGDIIRFTHGSIDVVHRVVDISEDRDHRWFITQGDNNNVADEPVLVSGEVGRVIAVVPKLGWPSVFLRDVFSG